MTWCPREKGLWDHHLNYLDNGLLKHYALLSTKISKKKFKHSKLCFSVAIAGPLKLLNKKNQKVVL